MKRRLALLLVLIAAVAVAAVCWVHRSEPNGDGLVRIYGNVEIRDAQLSFLEQHRVVEVLVDEGDVVEPGTLLAQQDDPQLQAQLAQAHAEVRAQEQAVRRLTTGTRPQEIHLARAEVEAASARLSNARRLLQRLEKTVSSGARSEQELDDARTQVEVAQAELNAKQQTLALAEAGFREEDIAEGEALLEAKRAQVRLLETRLADMALRAPSYGVIQSRLIEVGEMAGPSRTAIVLALTTPKWVRAYLPEPQLGRIRAGGSATVTCDSFPQRPLSGRVGFVSPQAEFTPKSVQTADLRTQLVYEVRIWVEDPENELRLGMPVSVTLDPSEGQMQTTPTPAEGV